MNKIGVIGSGFAGMSAASYLAKSSNEVHVFEKNEQLGGRARQIEEAGFKFDMGPSWYWMPDVIEKFFNDFGHTSSDFYDLKKLEPNFQMIFKGNETVKIPSNWSDLLDLFESIEKGSAAKLEKFMQDAEFKYKLSMSEFVYKPSHSLLEFFQPNIIYNSIRLNLFKSYKNYIRTFFKDPKLLSLMEFPVLFLGAMPKDIPSLYSIMNYSGLKQGTFYPMGGFGELQKAFHKVAQENGVFFHTSSEALKIQVQNNKAYTLSTKIGDHNLDGIIGAADYHHIESKLLEEEYRNYKDDYWDKKTFAPSCLLFYLGVNKRVPNLEHHNLFFQNDYEIHGETIYDTKKWPKDPLYYVCAPSVTDPSVAPEGNENLFLLMPIAPGLEDNRELRGEYFNLIMSDLEKYTGTNIRDHIVYKRSYCVSDFERDYNAYKGNAYGLANTLNQTAILKPKLKNKKVKNLFYAGQLTVPGPGVPPSIISGEIAAKELMKNI